ncbi:hypothetical protein RFI_06050, partial [Reticulomyxa filosa]
MTLLWIAFVVNVFELWYCSTPNGRCDSCLSGDNKINKLQLDSDTRLPRENVRKLTIGFAVSLVFLFISAVAMTSVTHEVFQNVEFFNFDKTWENNYNDHSKYILCNKKQDGRRLGDLANGEEKSSELKTKYSDEYDALCRNQTFYSTGVAVAFATMDWFLLLVLAVYWHTNDKYQTKMKYEQSGRVWRDFTCFYLRGVRSQISWLGRILGGDFFGSTWFYLHSNDATKLHRYLTENVPWFAKLDPKQPGASELMPHCKIGSKGSFIWAKSCMEYVEIPFLTCQKKLISLNFKRMSLLTNFEKLKYQKIGATLNIFVLVIRAILFLTGFFSTMDAPFEK